VVIKIVAALPFLNQNEAIIVFDIQENIMAQTTFHFSNGLNQSQEGLLELQALLRQGVHYYDDVYSVITVLQKSNFT